MQEAPGRVSSHRVVADMGFREMQTAVMAELRAALQKNSKLLEAETDVARAASVRTQASPCSGSAAKATPRSC